MTHIYQRRRQIQIIIIMFAAALVSGAVRVDGAWRHRFQEDTNQQFPRLRTLEYRRGEIQPTPLSWDEAGRQCSSPRDISKAVKDRVQYSRDMSKEDEWRSGRDTWDRGKGDCEDYAAAVKDLCTANGIKTEIFVIRSKTARKAHAVTMGRKNGRVWVSSNGSYREYQSLNDAKQEMARDLGWWAPEVDVFKVEQSGTEGRRRYVRTSADTWR